MNQYRIQELTKNIDADLFKSQFLTLEEGGRLAFPHVWDFDQALGNCDYFAAHRNFDRWDILGTYVWPNVVVLGDYRAEVEYMRKFYLDRLRWMNTEISFW